MSVQPSMTRSRHRSSRSKRDKDAKATTSFFRDSSGIPPGIFLLACLVLLGGLLLGGTAGAFGDSVVQLVSLPLIVLSVGVWRRSQLDILDKAALALLAGIALLGLIQLLPLPISVWSSLSARNDLLQHIRSVGAAQPWTSLSLNPYATERCLEWILPAIAMFLSVRWMSPRQRRAVILVMIFSALLVLALRVMGATASSSEPIIAAQQATEQAAAALKFGPPQTLPPQPAFALGYFSNHNHYGTFLAMTLPFVIAIGLGIWVDGRKNRQAQQQDQGDLAWLLTLVLVAIGLLAAMIETHSRAALVMGGLASLGSLALLRELRLKRSIFWSLVAGALVAVLLAIDLTASATLQRLDNSVDNDVRSKVHATTLDAARHFGPLGSGLGTFVEAYQQVEPREGFSDLITNHAHGDYHELWLETGILGVVLVIAFFGWFFAASVRVWRRSGTVTSAMLQSRAASLSIVLVLMHSYVDYPLRRTAILVVFGLVCALLVPSTAALPRKIPESSRGREKGASLARA